MNKYDWLALGLIGLVWLATGMTYGSLPETMVNHWGIDGEPNGVGSKTWAGWLVPLITIGVFVMLKVIPRIDPKKDNVAKFELELQKYRLVMTVFLAYVHGLMIWWNLGNEFNLVSLMMPAFSGLFFVSGSLVEKALPNYSVGIRTPWTLANEDVWRETHERGGKLFKALSWMPLLGLLSARLGFIALMTMALGVSGYSMVYSYLRFKHYQKK